MITSIALDNFRGFGSIELKPIRPITLLAGQNNTGKTTVLEAVNLACTSQGADFRKLPRVFRSQVEQHPNPAGDLGAYWSWLFPAGDFSITPQITINQEQKKPSIVNLRAEGSDRHLSSLRIFHEWSRVTPEEAFGQSTGVPPLFTFTPSGDVTTTGTPANRWTMPRAGVVAHTSNPTEVAELFNQASIRKGGEERLQELLKALEPRLKKLRYLKLPKVHEALVYSDVGLEEMLPSTLLGQGFNRVLEIMCRVIVSRLDVLLIDEIENGIHFSALRNFWHGLFEMAAKEKVQIIATTHSWECVKAAFHVSKDSFEGSLFQYLRLDRVNGRIQCTAPDQAALEVAEAQGWEMR